MFCAISGSVPEQPVVSSKSGHLFEKRLVVKALQDTGRCPITGETLTEDDLLELKTNKGIKPRPSPATSIPGLLGLFQNEWDALMLETHTVRQSLHTVRQELSHALYQHDAAMRVIARLIRERDEARAALATAALHAPATANAELANGKRPADSEMADGAAAKRARVPEEMAGITADVVEVLTQTSAELSKMRKARKGAPVTVASPDELENYSLLANQPLHSTKQGGILAVDLQPGNEQLVVTAGTDANIVLFDRSSARVMQKLTGHTKKVRDVRFIGADGQMLVSCGNDKTARLWRADPDDEGSFKCVNTFNEHTAEVVSLAIHPSGKYFVTASADKSWCFYDMENALRQVTETKEPLDPVVAGAYTCVSFHPDGVIMGTGTDENMCRIWDVRTVKSVHKFSDHTSPVTSLSFSENGYYLATSAADGVRLWDLRKLKNIRTIVPFEGGAPSTVAFDNSGLYLGVGGPEVKVYGVKQDWGVIKTFSDMPAKGVHCLRFASDARSLLVGAADHNLRIYGPPQ